MFPNSFRSNLSFFNSLSTTVTIVCMYTYNRKLSHFSTPQAVWSTGERELVSGSRLSMTLCFSRFSGSLNVFRLLYNQPGSCSWANVYTQAKTLIPRTLQCRSFLLSFKSFFDLGCCFVFVRFALLVFRTGRGGGGVISAGEDTNGDKRKDHAH